jgi:hypothetical protein
MAAPSADGCAESTEVHAEVHAGAERRGGGAAAPFATFATFATPTHSTVSTPSRGTFGPGVVVDIQI